MTTVILKALALCSLLNATPEAKADQKVMKKTHTAELSAKKDAGTGLTPMDQSNDEPDVQVTKRIREAVMKDDKLSFTAKNVKIITRGAEVTLRGEVKSTAERDAVLALATKTAGVSRVNDQLEIKPN